MLNDAAALELFDDAHLLARVPFALSAFQPADSGALRAKVLRSVGLASGLAVRFRLVDATGGMLEEGPLDGLTMKNRLILKGLPL